MFDIMENKYARYADVNPRDAKLVFNVYFDKKDQLVSRDAVTAAVKQYGISDNDVILIDSFLGASYQTLINLIYLKDGGCVFDLDITKEEAYKAIDSAIETAKTISSKSHTPARKASA